MAETAKYFRVTRKVQGVGYRAATERQARALGLTGWVRNCNDGSVELMAEGSQETLAKLEVWLHQGPQAARVTGVEIRYASQPESEGLEKPFAIRR